MADKTTLLRNARVLTLDPSRPRAEALLAIAGRIACVGSEAEVEAAARAAGGEFEVIDAGGRVVIPAFLDPHIHLLAAAARRLAVDCGPDAVRSIDDIVEAVRTRAATPPPGAWIRAAGYDELALAERRHPTRHDLDRAAPEHPVRLLHRSGHACVLNSRALALAGIDNETAEPDGSYIDRDLADGAPSGVLLELNDVVDRVVPPLAPADLAGAVGEVCRDLLAAGVTFIQDASATNGSAEVVLLDELAVAGRLRQTVAAMVGVERYREVAAERRACVKIVPRELEHELSPSPAELARLIREVDAAGCQVAVHAVSRQAVDAVAEAFRALGGEAVRARRHRVEHAGICSAATAALLGELGATVVTQPGFLYANGDLYLQRVAAGDLDDLYPLRRLLDAGVRVAASSDSPVAPCDPLRAIGAAVTRRSRTGAALGTAQAVGAEEALRMFTRDAAYAAGVEAERGVLAPGLAADCLVLSADPLAPDVDWGTIAVDLTLQAGEVVYRRSV